MAYTYPEIHIDSTEKFYSVLSSLPQGCSFRGQSDASWPLQTTLDRYRKSIEHELNQSAELNAIKNYRILADLEHITTSVEVLGHMQHYGGVSRLLDVTPSIFVALFFAFDSFGIEDKAVFVFNEPLIYCSCKQIYNHINDTTFDVEDDGPEMRIKNFFKDKPHVLFDKCQKFAAQCIDNSRGQRNTDGVLPIHCVTRNERMLAQNGSFIFPINFSKSFEENLVSQISSQITPEKEIEISEISTNAVVKLVFGHTFLENANKILNFANISPRTIYPDKVGLAKSIRYI